MISSCQRKLIVLLQAFFSICSTAYKLTIMLPSKCYNPNSMCVFAFSLLKNEAHTYETFLNVNDVKSIRRMHPYFDDISTQDKHSFNKPRYFCYLKIGIRQCPTRIQSDARVQHSNLFVKL